MEQADCSFFLMDVMVVFVTVVDFRSFFSLISSLQACYIFFGGLP